MPTGDPVCPRCGIMALHDRTLCAHSLAPDWRRIALKASDMLDDKIAELRADLASVEKERDDARGAMLANESELRRADGIIGQLHADLAVALAAIRRVRAVCDSVDTMARNLLGEGGPTLAVMAMAERVRDAIEGRDDG